GLDAVTDERSVAVSVGEARRGLVTRAPERNPGVRSAGEAGGAELDIDVIQAAKIAVGDQLSLGPYGQVREGKEPQFELGLQQDRVIVDVALVDAWVGLELGVGGGDSLGSEGLPAQPGGQPGSQLHVGPQPGRAIDEAVQSHAALGPKIESLGEHVELGSGADAERRQASGDPQPAAASRGRLLAQPGLDP